MPSHTSGTDGGPRGGPEIGNTSGPGTQEAGHGYQLKFWILELDFESYRQDLYERSTKFNLVMLAIVFGILLEMLQSLSINIANLLRCPIAGVIGPDKP